MNITQADLDRIAKSNPDIGIRDQMNPEQLSAAVSNGTDGGRWVNGDTGHVSANKYNASKTEYDCPKRGVLKFDSAGEYKRYLQLGAQESMNIITDLRLQVIFELQPAFTTAAGDKVRAIIYRADFVYIEGENTDDDYVRPVIEDYKGMETPVFKLKWKMMQYLYGDKYDLRITKGRS